MWYHFRNQSHLARVPPIVTLRDALNDGNCRLKMPVHGRVARDTLPHTFNIGVFKCSKSNSTTIKHIYDESANLIDSYDIAFDANDWWNLP